MKNFRLILATIIGITLITILFNYFKEDKNVSNSQSQSTQERLEMYKRNDNYVLQMQMFALYKILNTRIVFLGNSHTYNANWNELLGRCDIANRGINSDITSGYLHRMEFVLNLKPAICFVEGGVNDFYSKFTVDEVFNNLKSVSNILKSNNITPVFTTTFPVATNRENAMLINNQIQQLNRLLTKYCKDSNIALIDINPQITINGFLKPELTYDGLHLNAYGYKIWIREIESILNYFKINHSDN